jgi:protein tyrosine phosphatase (PTP) superfamily phosphohydrolase (DUF442 family)
MRYQLDTPVGRALAFVNMHLVDHGFVRAIYNNLYDVGGGLYRSSQPSPSQIRSYHTKLGLRSIINLRGENEYGSYPLEAEVCEDLGIQLVNFRLFSRQPPSVDEIHGFRDLIDHLTYPALMHCKSGADRAGIGAALFRIFRMGDSVENAAGQLHWKYGHFHYADAGVLDFFLLSYLERNAREPIAFMHWVATEYDSRELMTRYEKNGWSSLVADKLLQRE